MRSLKQIRSFVAVFEEGSFTAAALREGATQSGISQHIRHLEESLGAELFGSYALTESGKAEVEAKQAEIDAALARLRAGLASAPAVPASAVMPLPAAVPVAPRSTRATGPRARTAGCCS